MAARGGAETSQEESGVATRRIDSRTLGIMGMGTASGEVDPDDLVRKAPSPPIPGTDQDGTGRRQNPRDIATALMHPPVADLRKAAETIRDGSREISPEPHAVEPSSQEATRPREQPAHKSRAAQSTTSVQAATPRKTAGRRFPVFRGMIAGGLSGAFVGAAWMGLAMSPVQPSIESYMAPLPVFSGEAFSLSVPVMRLALLALLGSLMGFVSGAAGAPAGGNALNAIRCGLVGAVAGAALGMSGGLDPTSGFRIWPMAHWVRDLMLVGLLTPALNRILPGR